MQKMRKYQSNRPTTTTPTPPLSYTRTVSSPSSISPGIPPPSPSARQTKFQPHKSLHLNDAPVPDSPESCTCIDTPAQDTQRAAQTTASRDPSAGHVRSADKMSGSDQPCARRPSLCRRISCRSGGHPRFLGRRHNGVVVSRSWGS